jgi:hypothetical protein
MIFFHLAVALSGQMMQGFSDAEVQQTDLVYGVV